MVYKLLLVDLPIVEVDTNPYKPFHDALANLRQDLEQWSKDTGIAVEVMYGNEKVKKEAEAVQFGADGVIGREPMTYDTTALRVYANFDSEADRAMFKLTKWHSEANAILTVLRGFEFGHTTTV